MASRLSKLILSIILCLSFLPLFCVNFAWAEEKAEGNETSGQTTEDEGDELDGLDEPEPDGENPDNENSADEESVDENPVEEVPLSFEPGPSLLSETDEEQTLAPLAADYSVKYKAHVQNIGWQSLVSDGALAGTTGRSLRMEAITVNLAGTGLTGAVEYRAHVQNIGWQNWVADGAIAGTTGSSLRVEALSIRLTGDIASAYDVYYRVHAQNYGWLGWAKNGEDAGTAGYGLRMEAVEIRLVIKGGVAPGSTSNAFAKKPMALEASAHVQNVGWQAWVTGGTICGTTGLGLRMEALCLIITSPDYSGSVEYRAHVSGIGWQTWKKDGVAAGTTGQSRQMEAIEIKLTDEMATKYDVYYRAHIANIGWLGWTKNGETAGSVGLSCRLEALQVTLVTKGGVAPGSTVIPSLVPSWTAQANVSGLGWLSVVSDRATIGTTGQSRQMETFKLTAGGNIPGNIEYCAYVQGDGWQGWKSNGANAGTEGENKRIEAIRIRLTGDMANYYDIYYRAHSANWGWLGWAKNGANAGTTKVGYALEAFEIALVVKGGTAPGPTNDAYWETPPIPATYRAMNDKIANVYSPTGWLIAIDTKNCLLGVYSGSQGNWTNRFMWLCSPGTSATPTIKGTYYMGSRGYVFGSGYSCYYWTQISGDYLIHSVLYYPGTNTIMEGTMGVPGSHGCVRLDIQNAKWIYDNVPTRTTIYIY